MKVFQRDGSEFIFDKLSLFVTRMMATFHCGRQNWTDQSGRNVHNATVQRPNWVRDQGPGATAMPNALYIINN